MDQHGLNCVDKKFCHSVWEYIKFPKLSLKLVYIIKNISIEGFSFWMPSLREFPVSIFPEGIPYHTKYADKKQIRLASVWWWLRSWITKVPTVQFTQCHCWCRLHYFFAVAWLHIALQLYFNPTRHTAGTKLNCLANKINWNKIECDSDGLWT